MNLLAITGKKQSGKDEVIRILKNHVGKKRPIERVAFADKMKEECAKMLGISLESMENCKEMYRGLYQWYGTDYKRKINKDVWIREWLFRIKKYGTMQEHENPLVITPDVRFLNEADIVRQLGGKLWKVVRYNGEGSTLVMDESDITKAHISETELDLIAASTIINNTTMKAFESEVIMAYERWMKKLGK